jgi:hypothetical protein
MSKKVVCVMFLFCITGCTTTVKLSARNTLKDTPVNITAAIKDKNGNTQNEINLGHASAQNELSQEFEVEDDGQFETIANIPGSAVIFKEPRTVVGKSDPDPETVNIVNMSTWLDDTKSMAILSDSFKKLGDDIGAMPTDLKSSLQTVFGGIVVATPNANDKPGKIHFSVTPEELGVRIQTLDDLPFFQTEEKQSTTISGVGSLQARANIGPYAQFGGAYSSDSLYTLSWTIRGFGMVQKLEDPNKQASIQIKKLPKDTKENLLNALQANPNAKLYYVNKMYVIRTADMSIKNHKKLDSKADLNAANIVTATGVFSNEITNEESRHYGDVVLNYFGNILSPNMLLQDVTEENVNNLTLKKSTEVKEISPEMIKDVIKNTAM